MSPQGFQRLRRFTVRAAVLWACAALILSVVGQLFGPNPEARAPVDTTGTGDIVIVQWVGDGAAAAGVEVGERLVSVDGAPVLRWFRHRGWMDLRLGTTNNYTFERRDGSTYSVDLLPTTVDTVSQRLVTPLYAALLAVGVAYLAIGFLVWRFRPDRDESWAFALFASFLSTTLFGAMYTYDAAFGYERQLISYPFVAASMFHLFTTYPFEPHWILRRQRLRFLPYWVAALFIPLVVLEEPLGLPSTILPQLGFGMIMLSGFGCMGVLAVERYRQRGSEQSARADVMLIGACISFVPILILILIQFLFLRSSFPFPFAFALVWFVVFPIAVAYGIVRQELFEIRDLARSSVTYGAATLAITGFYALLITSASAVVSRFNLDARAPSFSVAFLFFAILAFNPLRNRLQALVDRVFDRGRTRYRSAVREISEAMVSMLSLEEIGDRVLEAATDSMGVERAMVFLVEEQEGRLMPFAWRGEWDPETREAGISAEHPMAKQLWMRRQELSRPDFDDESDPDVREQCQDLFDGLEVAVLVPILFGVDLLGVIALGRKASGERLSGDDRSLLRTLANNAAIAIENAKAFDEISSLNETLEARVEERTVALKDTQNQLMQSEKMRSLGQLVAGVAHELNNPIGFVHANLQLLDGYVDRLTSDEESDKARVAIGRLLARSREGTERVKKIVEDLRTFSRMDHAELQTVDLNEEIERTLALMEPRLKGRVEVERELGNIPPIRCFAGQLNQVFMNLLMNSCDALEDGGTIRVRTAPSGQQVRLEFADDGPGIPPDVLDRIFEPFFTTKPVGKGTGLGLSISHGIVERHGGRMEVDSSPGTGTTFHISLPLVASPPEEP